MHSAEKQSGELKPWQHDLVNRGFISSIFFFWMTRLVRFIFRNDLTDPEDTFLLPESLKAEVMGAQLQHLWDARLRRYDTECKKLQNDNFKKKRRGAPRLLPLLFRLFWDLLVQAALAEALRIATVLTSAAYLLVGLIETLDRFEVGNEPNITVGSLNIPYR